LVAIGDPDALEFLRQGLTDVWELSEVTQSSVSLEQVYFVAKRPRAQSTCPRSVDERSPNGRHQLAHYDCVRNPLNSFWFGAVSSFSRGGIQSQAY
jgi:hypothetical protein